MITFSKKQVKKIREYCLTPSEVYIRRHLMSEKQRRQDRGSDALRALITKIVGAVDGEEVL